MTIFTWALTLASLVGVVLNIRLDRRCFYVWVLTNAAWMAVDFSRQLYAQSALFAVYFALSVWGIFQWKKKEAV
jgi:nicotinamide riboside transporter PnuC